MKQFLYGAVVGYLFHLILASTVARAEESPLLFIDSEITNGSVRPIRDALQGRILAEGTSDIEILLDSPGGSVVAGQELINLIEIAKDKGHDVNCYVLNVAASMAFQILTSCTNRYAMPGSFLLWHGVRVQTRQPITAEVAQSFADDLGRMNQLTLSQLDGSLKMTPEEIRRHFTAETLWSGISLSAADPDFLTVTGDYYRLAGRIKTSVRTAQGSLMDLLGGVEYIYRWSGSQVAQ
jgi:ATP-dependent protease ClpP protease subunit